jgi:hypothetical protein
MGQHDAPFGSSMLVLQIPALESSRIDSTPRLGFEFLKSTDVLQPHDHIASPPSPPPWATAVSA